MLDECDPFWVIFPLIIYVVSDIIRGWRWKILLETSGIKMSILESSIPIFVSGISNYIFPRIGEAVRTGIAKKTHDVPISTSVGTIITERLVDLVIYFLLAVVVIIIEFDRIGGFVVARLSDSWENIKVHWVVSAGLVLLIIGAIVTIRHFVRKRSTTKTASFFSNVKHELLSIFRLRRKQAVIYIFLTLFMWFLYFAMYYSLFSMNEQSVGFTISAVLATMVLGTLGFLLPVPGAIGTFHFFVSYALISYNIDGSFAKMLAAFMHGNITITTIITGSLCTFLLLMRYNKIGFKKMIEEAETSE
jgi:uncharacterized protein (TIRG00374 family)